MPHLLYVTKEALAKLRTHPAYLFWAPMIQNFPIRHSSLEERSFYARDVEAENDYIYLTVDMKFVYCRDKLLSFLYEDQDLSFRLSAAGGILRTMDNKQFSALIGRVAEIASTSDITLVDTDKVYHPLLDSGFWSRDGAAAPVAPASALAAPAVAGGKAKGKTKRAAAKKKESPKEALLFGKYEKVMCDQIAGFRRSSKKSFTYLAEKFGRTKDEVKEICQHYQQEERRTRISTAPVPDAVREVSTELQETIVRMKKVSKKSYSYLAKKFDLPADVIQDICARHLKRPRHRKDG